MASRKGRAHPSIWVGSWWFNPKIVDGMEHVLVVDVMVRVVGVVDVVRDQDETATIGLEGRSVGIDTVCIFESVKLSVLLLRLES